MRGRAAEVFTFHDFDGGTVLGDPAGKEQLLAGIQWRGLADSASDINAHIGLHQAKTAAEAVAQHEGVISCSLAGVYVDKSHIAWIHGGRVPQNRAGWGPRPGWDLGDDPDIPFADWPKKFDPDEGYVASANERYPGWTAFPEPRYRHERQCELLKGQHKLSPDDLLAISYDEYDGCAARLCAVWSDLVPETAKSMVAWAESQKAKNTGIGRVHMGRFHALHHELLVRLIEPFLGESVSKALWDDLDMVLVLQDHLDDVLALEHPEFLSKGALKLLLAEAWPTAVGNARADQVSGPIHARHKSLLTQGKLPAFAGFSSPPHYFPGGPTSLFASRRNVLLGEEVITGPAFHMVIDMAVDGLRYNICGGASEKRFGPGYGTGLEAWLTGELEPLG